MYLNKILRENFITGYIESFSPSHTIYRPKVLIHVLNNFYSLIHHHTNPLFLKFFKTILILAHKQYISYALPCPSYSTLRNCLRQIVCIHSLYILRLWPFYKILCRMFKHIQVIAQREGE